MGSPAISSDIFGVDFLVTFSGGATPRAQAFHHCIARFIHLVVSSGEPWLGLFDACYLVARSAISDRSETDDGVSAG